MFFNVPVVSNLIFLPMYKKVNFVYAAADEIIAVSQTYFDRTLEVNRKCSFGHSIYRDGVDFV